MTLGAPTVDNNGLYFADHLHRWRAALGDAKFGLASITCVGDSLTFGKGSAGTNTETDTQGSAQSWPAQLRALFQAQYGDCGEGVIKVDDSRVTLAGTAGFATGGPVQKGRRLGSGADTATFNLPVCTEFDIVYWWDTTTVTKAPVYTIDGGADVTAATGSGAETFFKETVTGLAATTHTVVVKGNAAGSAYLSSVIVRKATTGVLVHRLGVSGYTAEDLYPASSFSAAQLTRMANATFRQTGTDLAIISVGINDQGSQSPAPDVYETRLRSLVDYVTNTVGGCVLLLAEPRAPNANPIGHNESAYYQRMHGIAGETPHVAFMDMADIWGSTFQAHAAGLQVAGSVHPTRKGHGGIAHYVYRALTSSLMSN